MRGSIVVLALAVTPFIAQAQHGKPVRSHVVRREMPALHRDDDNRRGLDKKCDSWSRGNPSQKGLDHRADPRKNDRDCDAQQPPTQSPPPPPPPTPDPAPAPAPPPPPAPAPDPAPAPAPDPAPAPLGHTVITGSVFFDIDQNGSFGPDEVAESGWTVQLTGPMNLTTTTDGNGSYTFSGLIAGTYTVCVVPPVGWVQTPIASAPSCGTNLYGYTIEGVQLAGDVEYSGVDFGFISQ